MSDIIAFFETYPEYLRDIVIFIIVFVVLGAISKLYFDIKDELAEKKLYKLYHQHLEDEKLER
nr:hypothetical protein [Clostridia bacterium]